MENYRAKADAMLEDYRRAGTARTTDEGHER
jgi:hypothetical protein